MVIGFIGFPVVIFLSFLWLSSIPLLILINYIFEHECYEALKSCYIDFMMIQSLQRILSLKEPPSDQRVGRIDIVRPQKLYLVRNPDFELRGRHLSYNRKSQAMI